MRTRSTKRFVATKSRPPLLRQPSNAPPSSRTMVARERHLPQFHMLLLRGEYVIFNFLFVFILIHWCFCLQLTLYVHLSLLWLSKHKEDTSATHPIILDEVGVSFFFYSTFFFLTSFAFCFLSPIHSFLHLVTFKLTLSPFLSTFP